jgi:hypothetical protein
MDASNAEDPTQDNSTQSDEEDREPFVLSDTFSERSERKRKSSAASSDGASATQPKLRKTVKTDGFQWQDSTTMGHSRSAVASGWHSKRNLDTAMFLEGM